MGARAAVAASVGCFCGHWQLPAYARAPNRPGGGACSCQCQWVHIDLRSPGAPKPEPWREHIRQRTLASSSYPRKSNAPPATINRSPIRALQVATARWPPLALCQPLAAAAPLGLAAATPLALAARTPLALSLPAAQVPV